MTDLPSVRTIAREQGIDIGALVRILQHRRKAGTQTEEDFVTSTLDIIPGMKADGFGNRFLTIGENPTVLWSCHTDTVSSTGGMQNVRWNGDVLELNGGKPGQSLGADDGAGLWLLLEMIKANVPGLYIFHREEEIGGNGSEYISRHEPDLLDGIQMAIAFDRKATTSIITHQRWGRCCSEEFALALAAKISPFHKPDDGGTFTDTANYVDQIGECTNVSVGYYKEHGHFETLDVAYLLSLREALINIDVSDLPIKRKPGEIDYADYAGWHTNYNRPTTITSANPNISKLYELVKTYPHTVAKLLDTLDFEADDFDDAIQLTLSGKYPAPPPDLDPYPIEVNDDNWEVDLPPNVFLYCRDCEDEYSYHITGFEDRCPECGRDDIFMTDESINA